MKNNKNNITRFASPYIAIFWIINACNYSTTSQTPSLKPLVSQDASGGENRLKNSVAVSVVTYFNAATDKVRILKENRNKSGIYI